MVEQMDIPKWIWWVNITNIQKYDAIRMITNTIMKNIENIEKR